MKLRAKVFEGQRKYLELLDLVKQYENAFADCYEGLTYYYWVHERLCEAGDEENAGKVFAELLARNQEMVREKILRLETFDFVYEYCTRFVDYLIELTRKKEGKELVSLEFGNANNVEEGSEFLFEKEN